MASRTEASPLDAGTAAAENFKVGDTVAVSTMGAKRRYEVTGIATFGEVGSLGRATMAIWDIATGSESARAKQEMNRPPSPEPGARACKLRRSTATACSAETA